jgi:DNA polymerase III epsilon subunit-like protein
MAIVYLEVRHSLSLMRIHSERMTNPGASLPLFALDFETTGLNCRLDNILEVGLAGPRPFHSLVSDAGYSSPGALATHGITEGEALRAGHPGAEVLAGMLEALGNGPVRIASHTASFERGFLEAWAGRLGLALPDIHWVCTLDLARSVCPDPATAKGLGFLARRLGLRHSGLHRAMADAALTLRLQPVLQAWETIRTELGHTPALLYLDGPSRPAPHGSGPQRSALCPVSPGKRYQRCLNPSPENQAKTSEQWAISPACLFLDFEMSP